MRLALALSALLLPALLRAEEAPVRLGERAVLVLRAPGEGGVSPDDRAAMAERRLAKALLDLELGPEDIRVEARREGADVLAGNQLLLRVLPGDAEAEGRPVLELAEAWAGALRAEFGELKRRDFTLRLMMKYLLVLAYPVLLVVALAGLRRLWRATRLAVLRMDEESPSPLRLGEWEVLSRRVLKQGLAMGVNAGFVLLSAAALWAFALATFYYFPATRGHAERALALLGDLAGDVGRAAWRPALRLLGIAAVGGLAHLALLTLDGIFDEVTAGRVKLGRAVTPENADTVEFMAKGLTLLATFILVVLLLPGTGGRVGTAALALFGLALALASVGIFKNILSGFLLAFLTTHRRGSLLRTEDGDATILRRGLLFTSVRLPDGRKCTVPNGGLLERPVFPGRSSDQVVWRGSLSLPEGARLSELQSLLAKWASQWGDHASASFGSVRDGRADFQLQLPFYEAADEVFLAVAADSLADAFEGKGVRLDEFAPAS